MSRGIILGLAVVLCSGLVTRGEVAIETVTVGIPGNAGKNPGETEPGAYGPYGFSEAVNYEYRIGKYEVTTGQYTAFLNAVADEDTYGLYNLSMSPGCNCCDCEIQRSGPSGICTYCECEIERSGSSGTYSYSVAGDWVDRPVECVSWGDAARFANWMHNGQPMGAQGPGTTEDGSYVLNGATSDGDLMAVTRKPNATWVIPSEDEWYKAAYDYPTSSGSVRSNPLVDPTESGNNATFKHGRCAVGLREVGAHEKPHSPYRALEKGGSVWEWNETALSGSSRGIRGGPSFGSDGVFWHASRSMRPAGETYTVGFRVAEVP